MDNEFEQKLNELRSKLPIDQFNLDVECRKQAVLYDETGDLRVRTRNDYHRAENKLKMVKSDLYMKIRRDPVKYGIDKVSEAAIEAAINLQQEYLESQEDLIEVGGLSDHFGNLLEAVEQRKSMLKELVSLYFSNYIHDRQDQSLIKDAQKMEGVSEKDILEFRNKRFEEGQVKSIIE